MNAKYINELEEVMNSDELFNSYLEIVQVATIRHHIEELIRKAKSSTNDGAKLLAIQDILNDKNA